MGKFVSCDDMANENFYNMKNEETQEYIYRDELHVNKTKLWESCNDNINWNYKSSKNGSY